jgi:hypothetical protein
VFCSNIPTQYTHSQECCDPLWHTTQCVLQNLMVHCSDQKIFIDFCVYPKAFEDAGVRQNKRSLIVKGKSNFMFDSLFFCWLILCFRSTNSLLENGESN